MVLLEDVIHQDLPKDVIFGKRQLGKIEQLVKFVLFIDIPWRITVTVVASAPLHNITLLKEIFWYEKYVNDLVEKSAWKAFSNHHTVAIV